MTKKLQYQGYDPEYVIYVAWCYESWSRLIIGTEKTTFFGKADQKSINYKILGLKLR